MREKKISEEIMFYTNYKYKNVKIFKQNGDF